MSRSLLLACLVFGARALAPRSWARAGSLRSVLTMKAAPVAELARDVDAFSRKNQVIKIIASDAERAAVAKRLDVASIEELVANVTLASQRRDLVVCDGAVRASIVRAEGDAAARVDGCEFRVLVAADESVERALFDGEVDADVEVADDDGMIDVGELVVQARERERETVARTLSPPPLRALFPSSHAPRVVQYLCLAVFPPPDGRGDADGRFAVEPGETIYDASVDGDLGA